MWVVYGCWGMAVGEWGQGRGGEDEEDLQQGGLVGLVGCVWVLVQDGGRTGQMKETGTGKTCERWLVGGWCGLCTGICGRGAGVG